MSKAATNMVDHEALKRQLEQERQQHKNECELWQKKVADLETQLVLAKSVARSDQADKDKIKALLSQIDHQEQMIKMSKHEGHKLERVLNNEMTKCLKELPSIPFIGSEIRLNAAYVKFAFDHTPREELGNMVLFAITFIVGSMHPKNMPIMDVKNSTLIVEMMRCMTERFPQLKPQLEYVEELLRQRQKDAGLYLL